MLYYCSWGSSSWLWIPCYILFPLCHIAYIVTLGHANCILCCLKWCSLLGKSILFLGALLNLTVHYWIGLFFIINTSWRIFLKFCVSIQLSKQGSTDIIWCLLQCIHRRSKICLFICCLQYVNILLLELCVWLMYSGMVSMYFS